MPKNNCLFQARWLKDKWFEHWTRKKMTLAMCSYCSKDVSVAIMEQPALMSHKKGKKHVKRSPSDQVYQTIDTTNTCSPVDHIEN